VLGFQDGVRSLERLQPLDLARSLGLDVDLFGLPSP
jgi:hypothetical protein